MAANRCGVKTEKTRALRLKSADAALGGRREEEAG